MTNEEIDDRYSNHNKLVVDKAGRLVYIMWESGRATDYEVVGVKESFSFSLRKLKQA